MKRILIFICLPLLLIFIQCDEEEAQIKQLRIELWGGTSALGTLSTIGLIAKDDIFYHSFNKNNYLGLKSIIFTAKLMSTQSDNDCILELYNLTDKTAIDSSALASHSAERLESGNLIEYFPDYDIGLTIRLRTESSNVFVTFSSAYLYLIYGVDRAIAYLRIRL